MARPPPLLPPLPAVVAGGIGLPALPDEAAGLVSAALFLASLVSFVSFVSLVLLAADVLAESDVGPLLLAVPVCGAEEALLPLLWRRRERLFLAA